MSDPANPDQVPELQVLRFPALEIRNFRIYWISQAISMTGFWMQNIGQAWLVLKLTESPLELSYVVALQSLPVLFLSLIAGAIVDRFDKRRVIFVTQALMGALALILGILVAFNQVQLWQVFALSFLLGLVNTVDVPARQAFVIELAGRETLMNAISLNSTVFNMARIVGPAIAGVLIGIIGIAPMFLFNAVSFGAVLIALLFLDKAALYRPAKRAAELGQESPGLVRATLDGLRYLAARPEILLPIILLGILSTFVINYNIVVPLFAKKELAGDAMGFGFLMASLGLGSFISAFSLAAGGRQKPDLRRLYLGALAMSVCLIFLGLQNQYWLSCLILFAIGYTTISFTSSCNSHIQIHSDDEYRGRVMGVFALVFGGVTPIGSMWTGAMADRWGLRIAMAASGLIGIVASVAVIVLVKRLAKTRQASN